MRRLNKYLWIAYTAARSNLAYAGEAGARALFVAVVLYIFLRLWTVVYASSGGRTLGGLTLPQMLWYLTVTEAVWMSSVRLWREVDEDVRTGRLAAQLLKPISYPCALIAKALGERIVRFGLNIAAGSAVTLILAGPIPITIAGLSLFVLVIPLAFILDALGFLLIGLCAFWCADTNRATSWPCAVERQRAGPQVECLRELGQDLGGKTMQSTRSDNGDNLMLTTLRDTPPWDWPEGTDKMLLAILRDDAAPEADRLIATDLGGDFTVINDDLADALLSIVSAAENSEALRSAAASGLGPVLEHADIEGFDDPDAVPILEETFDTIRATLRELFMDTALPQAVRRSILEASVRAPEDWHEQAILAASAGNDREWLLTAVFCMGHVRGFDRQIVEALSSTDADIQFEAVRAAGNWELEAAEPHIVRIINSKDTDKSLLLAAIEAAGYVCPDKAPEILSDLAESPDEDIAEAALEALQTAEGFSSEYDEDEIDEDDEDDDGEDDEADDADDANGEVVH